MRKNDVLHKNTLFMNIGSKICPREVIICRNIYCALPLVIVAGAVVYFSIIICLDNGDWTYIFAKSVWHGCRTCQ